MTWPACCCDDRCHDCHSWCFHAVRLAHVNFRHCSAHRYFTRFSAQNRPQSSQVSEGVCSMGAKTAKAGTAGHANDDISWQPAALQDRRGCDAGEDCNGWWDLGSSLSTGDKAGFNGNTKNRRLRPSSRLCPQQAKWWLPCSGTWEEYCLLSFRNTVEL